MIKHPLLSYTTHFLKIGGYLFGINFLANEIRQYKTLAEKVLINLITSLNF